MKKELLQLVENNFSKDKYFPVDISLIMLRSIPKLKITADSDTGIGIDECAELSRKLTKLIEESGITQDFEIEVSSPGVGEPLKLERQYVKNIGRAVKITTNEGKVIAGKLLQVYPLEAIEVEEVVKVKGKKDTEQTIHKILFSDIKKTVVEVSFN